MHLINVETFSLETFTSKSIPPYAILSHTWGTEKEEVSFSDIRKEKFEKTGNGVEKLRGCCNQARVDGLRYAWIDTCCINKDSEAELSEAINSMFQWYRKATVCYVYLSDVTKGDKHRDSKSKFSSSRWFQRGWTLQELLAPKDVRFYSQEWAFIGTKGDYSDVVETITGIPPQFLLHWQELCEASVAQRLSWAANRKTKRMEDAAYCLLGIFGVGLTMRYGEGNGAMHRLQKMIMQNTGDHSILAWGLNPDTARSTPSESADVISAGILATTPLDFANSGKIVVRRQDPTPINAFNISDRHLEVQLSLHTTLTGEVYGLLNCGPEQHEEQVVAIPLHKDVSSAPFEEYLRPQGRNAVLLSRHALSLSAKVVHIQMKRQIRAHRARSRRLWLHIEGHQKINLRPEGDYPPATWENERAMIAEASDSGGNITRRYLARFRNKDEAFRDVVVVVEFEMLESQVQARCYAMTLSRGTTLEKLSQNLISIRPEALDKQVARIGTLHVEVKVKLKMIGEERMLIVTLRQANDKKDVTVDADLELEHVSLRAESQRISQEIDHVRVEAERLAQQHDQAMVILGQTKNSLAAVEEELRRLEEEKRSLSIRVERDTQLVDELTKELNESSQQQNRWSERESEIQRRLEELDKLQDLGNWHEEMIEPQPDTSESSSAHRRPSMAAEMRHRYDIDCQRLLQAAHDGQEAVVRSLLEKGVDMETTDHEGNTPLALAAYKGHLTVTRMLLEKGANLEAKDDTNSDTPLSRAAGNGQEDVVRLLLEKGAQLEVRNTFHSTPLSWAAHCGQRGIVKLLLEKGAGREAKNKYGNTPLSLAASNRHEAVVRLLLEEGADTRERNIFGKTPLQCAEHENNKNMNQAVVDLLRERERSTTKATRRSTTNSFGSAILSLPKKMTARSLDQQR